MSFRVVAKVLRESDEKLARRLILLVLAEAASDDGIAWVGQEEIAEKARLSRTHVAERIVEMRDDGAIELRKAKRGRRRINVYRLVLHGLDEPDYDRLPFVLDEPFTTSEVPTPLHPTASDPRSDGVGSSESTASDPPTPRARDPLSEPSEDSASELETLAADAAEVAPSGPPKLTKIDGRDLAFDVLAEVCGVDPGGNRAREVGIALNGSPRSGLAVGIRELAWREQGGPILTDVETMPEAREAWERILAERIRQRALIYREGMRGAALTPLALAKWWTDLDSAARRRDPAAEAMERAVRLADEGR